MFLWPLCWYDCAEISKLFLELVRPNEFLSHGLLNISRVIKIIFKMSFFCKEHTLRSDLKGPWSSQTCFTHKTQQLQDWQSVHEWMWSNDGGLLSIKTLSLSTTTTADLQPNGSPSASVTSASLTQSPVKIQMRADFQLGFILRKLNPQPQ